MKKMDSMIEEAISNKKLNSLLPTYMESHKETKDYIKSYDYWQTDDGDHYPTIYDNETVKYETGKHTSVESIADQEYDSYHWIIHLDGRSYSVPFSDKISTEDVLSIARAYDYCSEQINTMTSKEASKSDLPLLQKEIIRDILEIYKGNQKGFSVDVSSYLSEPRIKDLSENAKLVAKAKLLQEAEVIPNDVDLYDLIKDQENLDKNLDELIKKQDNIKNIKSAENEISSLKDTIKESFKLLVDKMAEYRKIRKEFKKQYKDSDKR